MIKPITVILFLFVVGSTVSVYALQQTAGTVVFSLGETESKETYYLIRNKSNYTTFGTITVTGNASAYLTINNGNNTIDLPPYPQWVRVYVNATTEQTPLGNYTGDIKITKQCQGENICAAIQKPVEVRVS